MSKEGVSIIICCYNSSLRIEKTLEHLANQEINDIGCEIILVDNASSDNTVNIAKAVWSKIQNSKFVFSIIHEKIQGVAYARKKGANKANYEYLIFCDDDNWLDQTYVKNVYELFVLHPEISVLGGMGIAQFEDESLKPVWFDKFYQSYAIGDNVEKTAGMAIRKSILIEVMNNQPMFLHGRKQNHLSSGEDAEICLRVRLAGYKILYSPQLTFQHFLTKKRLTWDYLKKLSIGFAQTNVVLCLYERALNSQKPELSPFYWLKKGLYYWGIYLKYWPKHYSAYKNGEGTIEEIHHITWSTIAKSYWRYNFKTIKIYNKIIALKNEHFKSN